MATSFLVSWQARSTGRRAGDVWVRGHELIAAIMLLHPDYPALHRRETLAALVGVSPRTRRSSGWRWQPPANGASSTTPGRPSRDSTTTSGSCAYSPGVSARSATRPSRRICCRTS
ncbi:hypothetical protein ACFQX7_00780 [Luedemannella flava]